MSSFDDFLSRLDPKDAKKIKTADSIETIKYPLASRRLTSALRGGIGAGRITTIYGNTSAGKTLLTLQTIGKLQKQGKVCGFIDVEGTFDESFATRLGVNCNELLIDGSKAAGKVERYATMWMKAGMDLIVADSISDIMPDVHVDDKTGNLSEGRKQLGAHAKAITNLIHGIHYNNERTAVILLSQTTTKIESTYTKQIPHGGQRIFFDSSTVIRLTSSNTDAKQKKGKVQVGTSLIEMPIGRTVEAFVEKNKIGPQHRTAEYDIYYDGPEIGIDTVGELADLCVEFGIINKGGAWFKYQDQQWQGRDSLVQAIKSDPNLEIKLESKLAGAMYG